MLITYNNLSHSKIYFSGIFQIYFTNLLAMSIFIYFKYVVDISHHKHIYDMTS